MTQIPNPTTPSVDIPNPNVDDEGRINIGTPGADRIPGTPGSDNIAALSNDDLVAPGGGRISTDGVVGFGMCFPYFPRFLG
ncbi:MAG: hypothetical protein F6K39_39895, partial [Okeania sp. SIO3B3]|nr:hypothetical protein [Okeania sp. SIO3B3]